MIRVAQLHQLQSSHLLTTYEMGTAHRTATVLSSCPTTPARSCHSPSCLAARRAPPRSRCGGTNMHSKFGRSRTCQGRRSNSKVQPLSSGCAPRLAGTSASKIGALRAQLPVRARLRHHLWHSKPHHKTLRIRPDSTSRGGWQLCVCVSSHTHVPCSYRVSCILCDCVL